VWHSYSGLGHAATQTAVGRLHRWIERGCERSAFSKFLFEVAFPGIPVAVLD